MSKIYNIKYYTYFNSNIGYLSQSNIYVYFYFIIPNAVCAQLSQLSFLFIVLFTSRAEAVVLE